MSRGNEPHPTYLAAAPEERWRSGPLTKLWEFLERTSAEHPEKWVRVVLPGGAIVAMRVREGEPRELSIGRIEPFASSDGSRRWEVELDTFAKHFGIEHWRRTTAESRRGGPMSMFTERPALDLFGAAEARDEALERVEKHADESWKEAAIQAIGRLCDSREYFTVDAVWETGLEKPVEARAIGAIMLRASREGYCEPTARFETGTQVKSHANPRRVWRSLTFNQRRAG